jgi:hypothetical protein
MSKDYLSEREQVTLEVLPSTPLNIADLIGEDVSAVYGTIGNLMQYGYDIQQDSDGRYYLAGDPPDDAPSHVAPTVVTAGDKQRVSQRTKKWLAEVEHRSIQKLDGLEPVRSEVPEPMEDGGMTMLFHRTDDHFGELIENQHGEVVCDTDIVEARCYRYFDEGLAFKEQFEHIGEFDSALLFIGGDIVTNDDTYENQAAEVEMPLEEQLDRAVDVYVENIKRLSDAFPYVKVVGIPGNHGRLSRGSPSNADNILYSIIERVLAESKEVDNVDFFRSAKSYYIDFTMRDFNIHARHGHDSSLEHIGTSASKARWRSWLIDHGFDLALRGHYHGLKEEPVNGVPVLMGGTLIDQTNFEESHALSGRPMGAVHIMTDDHPVKYTRRVTFQ